MLTGKRCLVTGSSQGIGLAVAAALARHGASVVLTSDRPLDACPEVATVLARHPDRTHYFPADVTVDGMAELLVGQTWGVLGGVDVLVNNVGTFREPAFLELDRDHFDFIFRLNVWSAIAVTQAVVRRATAANRGGRILFTTSLNATRSEPGHTLYDASKGAINSLTRQLAIELAPLGFTTAAVAPGLVETPLTDFGLKSSPTEREQVLNQIPLKKIASVDDVAEWFAFLASDAASYGTGIVIPVDGGLDAQQMSVRPVTAAEKGERGASAP
jgi:NAD(P)-dependent dehydrogenase (short-subunit alcohol dehydrogenase family)